MYTDSTQGNIAPITDLYIDEAQGDRIRASSQQPTLPPEQLDPLDYPCLTTVTTGRLAETVRLAFFSSALNEPFTSITTPCQWQRDIDFAPTNPTAASPAATFDRPSDGRSCAICADGKGDLLQSNLYTQIGLPMTQHPNSLENLKLGSLSRKGRGSVKIRKNIYISPACAEILSKSGNASRFIELLVRAHQERRLLDPSELLGD